MTVYTAACSEKTYQIGDVGPAGGTIFYDKGKKTEGWRYLEAAPADTEFSCNWQDRFFDDGNKIISGTKTEIGTGKANTKLIVNYFKTNNLEYDTSAAVLCANLKVGEYADWFMPSQDELNLMYENLHKQGLGGFQTTETEPYSYETEDGGEFVEGYGEFYFSSSLCSSCEYGDGRHVWAQDFGLNYGHQFEYDKFNTIFVRAIRAF